MDKQDGHELVKNSIILLARSQEVLTLLNDKGLTSPEQVLVLKTAASLLEHKQAQDSLAIMMQAQFERIYSVDYNK